jgi:hypothetical protein
MRADPEGGNEGATHESRCFCMAEVMLRSSDSIFVAFALSSSLDFGQLAHGDLGDRSLPSGQGFALSFRFCLFFLVGSNSFLICTSVSAVSQGVDIQPPILMLSSSCSFNSSPIAVWASRRLLILSSSL